MAFDGWLLSISVAGILGWLLYPSGPIKNAIDRGRLFASIVVMGTTSTTLFRYPYPPPEGGMNAIVTWLIVSIVFGLIAFCIGAFLQLLMRGGAHLREHGPEMLNVAAQRSNEFIQDLKTSIQQHSTANEQVCNQCQSLNPMTNNFCKNCGNKMPKPTFCTACGAQRLANEHFCGNCGRSNNADS